MRAFIFDKYGYYEDDEFASEFDYQGWHFKLEKTDRNEEELEELNEYVKRLENLFFNSGISIIKNREGNLLSKSEFGDCALVSIKNRKMELSDLLQMHTFFKDNQDQEYTVKEMLKLWEDKVDLINEKVIPSIKIGDYRYEEIMTSIIFAMGLAENAMQYLAELELDLGNKINNLTLAHKRLYTLSSYEFFSPLNLIVDNPMRDLAELYKSSVLNNESLLNTLNYYNPSKQDVSLLLARILFPTTFFDQLDDYYVLRKDVKSNVITYKDNANMLLNNLKNLEQNLTQKYGIRPIKWLN